MPGRPPAALEPAWAEEEAPSVELDAVALERGASVSIALEELPALPEAPIWTDTP